MNDFCRILLALELEPCLKAKALSNQQLGGRLKGSSNLTKDATVDVRKEIAIAAGVSLGNVTKVKRLLTTGQPELLETLRSGEVSIHRAWKWTSELPDRQNEALRTYRNKNGVNKAIRDLIARHKPRNLPTSPDLASLVRRLSGLSSGECSSVDVSVIPNRAGSRKLSRDEAVDDSPGSKSVDRIGLCADYRRSRPLSAWQAGGELSGTHMKSALYFLYIETEQHLFSQRFGIAADSTTPQQTSQFWHSSCEHRFLLFLYFKPPLVD